jgi:hypothetical protein
MRHYFGKRLFPKLPPDLRHRRMKNIYLTVLVIVVLGGAICVVMIVLNAPGKN